MANDQQAMNSTTHLGHPLWGDDVIVPITIVTDTLILLLNILPIYTVVRQKRLFPYALDEAILTFSSTEIISILMTMPLGLTSYFTRSWPGGQVTCAFYQAVVIWSELMTMCIVTTMGIERIACVKRLVAGDCSFKRNDLKKHRIRLAVITAISLLLAGAPAVGLAPSGYRISTKSCQSVLVSRTERNEQYIFYLSFLMIGYFNTIINTVIYSSIIAQLVTLKKVTRAPMVMDTTSELEQMEIRSQRQEVVVSTVMVVIVALVYYTTAIPALILVTIQKVAPTAVHTRVVVYSLLVSHISGVLLPLLYPLVSKRYRAQYRRLLYLLCRCRCQNMYGETIPDLLPSGQPTDSPDTGSQHSDTTVQPIESCQVIPRSSSIVFVKSGCVHNELYQPIGNNLTDSQPISDELRNNCCSNMAASGTTNMNGGVMNKDLRVLEEDMLEETTYITHDSEDEDNEFCTGGSRLNLMSSDED